MQSTAFDKSIKTGPTISLLEIESHQLSIRLIRTWFAL